MKTQLETQTNDVVDIAKSCAQVLDEKKALSYVFMDLREINSYFSYFLIAVGNSHTHCKSLAKEIRKYFDKTGLKEKSKPDLNSGWIILDYGYIIIHIFTEEMNTFYQLEKLWGDAKIIPV